MHSVLSSCFTINQLVIFHSRCNKPICLSVCPSVCLSVRQSVCLQPAQGKIRKRHHILNTNYPGLGSESKCVPLVLKHFGRWGEEALRFLDQLSRKNQNVVQFKSHWTKRLSVILQKCNTRVLLKKLSRHLTVTIL